MRHVQPDGTLRSHGPTRVTNGPRQPVAGDASNSTSGRGLWRRAGTLAPWRVVQGATSCSNAIDIRGRPRDVVGLGACVWSSPRDESLGRVTGHERQRFLPALPSRRGCGPRHRGRRRTRSRGISSPTLSRRHRALFAPSRAPVAPGCCPCTLRAATIRGTRAAVAHRACLGE